MFKSVSLYFVRVRQLTDSLMKDKRVIITCHVYPANDTIGMISFVQHSFHLEQGRILIAQHTSNL